MLLIKLQGYRDWSFTSTSPKDQTGHLNKPVCIGDSAESGLGYSGNRHLNYLAESILVNVGDSHPYVKVSSPPMMDVRVGGDIVV